MDNQAEGIEQLLLWAWTMLCSYALLVISLTLPPYLASSYPNTNVPGNWLTIVDYACLPELPERQIVSTEV